jgi:general secretion pathway protein N
VGRHEMRGCLIALCAGIATALVMGGGLAAQTRLAVTPPANGVDRFDIPATTAVPSGYVPPPSIEPRPAAAGVPSYPAVVGGPELRGNPLWDIALQSLSFTRDRPLFSPSRRPPPPPAAVRVEPARPASIAKPAAPERPQFTLVGVVVGPTEKIAVLLDEATKEVVRLQLNEERGGWTLRTVKGREATLQKDQWTAVLAVPPPGQSAQQAADPTRSMARAALPVFPRQ